MPVFTLTTNVPQAEITGAFLKQLSATLAKLLHKPEVYMAVHVVGDQKLTFAGTSEPAGFAAIRSIGSVGPAENNKLSAELFPLIEKELGIPGTRLYIEFVDLHKTAIAHNGATFEHIL